MPHYTLMREERLRGRKLFSGLFARGKTFALNPFRVTWLLIDTEDGKNSPLQAAFVVPKRNFKKAAHRNLIRRRMKEAYRLNKNELSASLQKEGKGLIFTCVFASREECQYAEIEHKIIVTLQRLAKETSGISAFPANQP
jgi:ribonuclease P protein component